MKRVFSFIGIILWSATTMLLHADTTYVSGHITSDTSWTKANSPYIVVGDVYVDSGVTLVIEPGVEVRLDSMKRIEIYGTLNAIGSESDSILIGALDTTKRWSHFPKQVNINKASKEELVSLPHIGEIYAQRIIEYRERYGGFKSIEEIKQIKGIGEKTFEKLKDKITI